VKFINKLVNVRNLSIFLFPLILVGCNKSKYDIYLSWSVFTDKIKVYGNNIEEKKEPLILPVQIKRIDGVFQRLLNPPVYKIQVGNTVFENKNLFVDDTQYIGTNERNVDSYNKTSETKFNINRNTNQLIYYDFTFSPKDKVMEKSQITINFEGKCEKVKEKIWFWKYEPYLMFFWFQFFTHCLMVINT